MYLFTSEHTGFLSCLISTFQGQTLLASVMLKFFKIGMFVMYVRGVLQMQ